MLPNAVRFHLTGVPLRRSPAAWRIISTEGALGAARRRAGVQSTFAREATESAHAVSPGCLSVSDVDTPKPRLPAWPEPNAPAAGA